MKRQSTFAQIVIVAAITAAMVIACGNESKVLERFNLIADGERTAFAQTLATYPVEYDSLAMGVFVKSINGVAGTKTAYWLYFVNSKPIPQASNAFVPARGDTVEWRLISGY
ncbi:MAG: DUF4430 domain-containing protein [Candidatus Zixiibacteriota bacterium]